MIIYKPEKFEINRLISLGSSWTGKANHSEKQHTLLSCEETKYIIQVTQKHLVDRAPSEFVFKGNANDEAITQSLFADLKQIKAVYGFLYDKLTATSLEQEGISLNSGLTFVLDQRVSYKQLLTAMEEIAQVNPEQHSSGIKGLIQKYLVFEGDESEYHITTHDHPTHSENGNLATEVTLYVDKTNFDILERIENTLSELEKKVITETTN